MQTSGDFNTTISSDGSREGNSAPLNIRSDGEISNNILPNEAGADKSLLTSGRVCADEIKAKVCTGCAQSLPVSAYYSKGLRRDAECIVCVLKKKKERRIKARSKRERRKKTKVLEMSDLKIQEIVNDKTTVPQEQFTELLRAYVFELALNICKERKND